MSKPRIVSAKKLDLIGMLADFERLADMLEGWAEQNKEREREQVKEYQVSYSARAFHNAMATEQQNTAATIRRVLRGDGL